MNALLYDARCTLPLRILSVRPDQRRGRLNGTSHALSSITDNRMKTEKGEVAGPIEEKQV